LCMTYGILSLAIFSFIKPAMAENTAVIPVSRDTRGWMERHQKMNDKIKEGNINVLWIGDSIVERWENKGRLVWKKYYEGRDAVNLGIGGDQTQHVLWRLDHLDLDRVSPRLAIVMIGQNNGPHNTAEEIAEGVTAIVTQLRQKKPDMKILLLAIFFRGENPNEEQIKLTQTNSIISKLDDGQHVFYLDINKIFLLPDGKIQGKLMPDYEHPNADGCKVWAEAIESKVAELLGDKPIKP
jgi:lysophospholipase L1-like esterase